MLDRYHDLSILYLVEFFISDKFEPSFMLFFDLKLFKYLSIKKLVTQAYTLWVFVFAIKEL